MLSERSEIKWFFSHFLPIFLHHRALQPHIHHKKLCTPHQVQLGRRDQQQNEGKGIVTASTTGVSREPTCPSLLCLFHCPTKWAVNGWSVTRLSSPHQLSVGRWSWARPMGKTCCPWGKTYAPKNRKIIGRFLPEIRSAQNFCWSPLKSMKYI